MPIKLYDVYQCEKGLKIVPNIALQRPQKQYNITYAFVGLYIQENANPVDNLNAQILTKYTDGEYAEPFDLDADIDLGAGLEPVYVDFYATGATTPVQLNTNNEFAAMLDDVMGFTHAAL